MEDNTFDKFIKEKLQDIEPAYENGSWESFQKRLDTPVSVSWYNKFRTEILVVTALLLFTIFNGYIHQHSMELGKKNIIQYTAHENQGNGNVTDSLLFIVKDLAIKHAYLLNKLDSVTEINKQLLGEAHQKYSMPYYSINNRLSNKNVTSVQSEDNDKLEEDVLINDHNHVTELLRTPAVRHHFQQILSTVPSPKIQDDLHQHVSLSQLKEIEQHYFHGIGIEVGPHVDAAGGLLSIGHMAIAPRIGVAIDFILSPNWSIETGLDYTPMRFQFEGSDMSNAHLPEPTKPIGVRKSAETLFNLGSTPVNIKYRKWFTERNQIFVKLGYTPYFDFQQRYTYNWTIKNQYEEDYDDNYNFNEIQHTHSLEFFGGTASLSLGITRILRTKQKLELAVYSERSLSSISPAQLNLNLYGLRAAYWFKIK